MKLTSGKIRHAPLSNRIVLARFGKDQNVALDTEDATSDFWQTLISYAFSGKMPNEGSVSEVSFGGGNEQFIVTIKRKKTPPSAALAKMETGE